MDHLIGWLVRLFSFLGKVVSYIPFIPFERYPGKGPVKLLLVGYNGARNTGSDLRVIALVDQINAQCGAENVCISVMSLDKPQTARYFADYPNVTVIGFTTLFFWPLLKACSSHHAIVLCEGSMLKSTFANALALFMCEAAGIAQAQKKPCVAYGVEAGAMDPLVKNCARKLCASTYFMVRTEESLSIIEALGLHGIVGTDTAWSLPIPFDNPHARTLLESQGWDGSAPLVGVAAIDPFCWPGVASISRWLKGKLTGNWDMHYSQIYFLSTSPERIAARKRYLAALADAVDNYCACTKSFPVIIGMEKLDTPPCRELSRKLKCAHGIVLAENCDAHLIDGIISRLKLLITSRYHAALLGFRSGVASVAVSMDERLESLFKAAGFEHNRIVSVRDENLAEKITAGITSILSAPHPDPRITALARTGRETCELMALSFATYLQEELSWHRT